MLILTFYLIITLFVALLVSHSYPDEEALVVMLSAVAWPFVFIILFIELLIRLRTPPQ